MPEGFVLWAIVSFIAMTLVWAAVWWWLPAIFRGHDGGRGESRSDGGVHEDDSSRMRH